MAKKNPYTATIKYFKRFKDRWYIEFLDDKAYLCDGHMIASMPICLYQEYIVTSIAGIPSYIEDGCYTIQDSKAERGTVKIADMYNNGYKDASCPTRPSKILIDTDRWMSRAFMWEIDGLTTGALINDEFYKISLEFSNGYYYASKKNAPIYTLENVYDTGYMVLPIHYDSNSPFWDILENINKANKQAA